VTRAGLAALAGSGTLRELKLSKVELHEWPAGTGTGTDGWASLEQLTLLDVELVALPVMPALRELRIYLRGIEPGALAAIAGMPQLERLTLWCTKHAIALEELAGAPALRELSLDQARVTAEGLASITAEEVTLDRVEPLDVGALARGGKIRTLDVRGMPLDDAGLLVLGEGGVLKLRLRGTAVTDAGVAKLLATKVVLV
jgi:hypothetical protein